MNKQGWISRHPTSNVPTAVVPAKYADYLDKCLNSEAAAYQKQLRDMREQTMAEICEAAHTFGLAINMEAFLEREMGYQGNERLMVAPPTSKPSSTKETLCVFCGLVASQVVMGTYYRVCTFHDNHTKAEFWAKVKENEREEEALDMG